MPQDAMAASAIILLLSAVLGIASTQVEFYGESVNFMPLQKNKDGTFQVSFYYRENGKGSCENQLSYSCESGVCTSFDRTAAVETDRDASGQDRWCQSEGHGAATIPADKSSISLSASGCCWASNIGGEANWTASAELDLGTRSDTHTFNNCPVTATVATLRAPQNCFSRLRLLAHDLDGDHVRCRFAANASVDANVELDEDECTVKTKGQLGVGVHVFDVVLEDFSTQNVTLSYADGTSAFREAFNKSSSNNLPPFCQVALQFTLEILPSVPNCVAGHVQPQFLSLTPSYGDVRHATVGNKLNLYAQAQASHAKIYDFQVSGPQNMTKEFKIGTFGKAEVTLSWTPQLKDLQRVVPVCFTAETSESQSEMRCVLVMVTKSSQMKGNAIVTCSANRMTVALEKASMPDIDENWLKLRDPTCSLTSNDTHIMGTMSFSTCGTKIEDKGDFILFKNEIQSFEQPNTVITRRRGVNIDFSCQFPKTISISSYYELHKSDYVFTESSFGSFGYTFEIFTDSGFTSKVPASAYPVEVKLLDIIYMGIEAESELPDVTLFVESCKATPDDNPEGSLFYSLIDNGCKTDETVKVHTSDPKSFKFEVQAFKFTGNYDQVYITCSVILCETGNPFSRCAQGCLSSPGRRRKRALSLETASHYISQGPLRLVRQAVPNAAVDELPMLREADPPIAVKSSAYPPGTKAPEREQGGWAILGTNISTTVFASLFTVSIVVLAVVTGYFARKTRAGDRNPLLVTDWEN
ncbi:uncharacterized protein [Centroberyx affinis]|uniref:uncharacterized protein n=1 Tax=Centroberyx affinis TaxID=166261 RepID=UPI003A5BC3F1